MSNSLSALAQDALAAKIDDVGCYELNLPTGSTYAKALILGILERSMRGSTADARLMLELAGSMVTESPYEDALSQAMREFSENLLGDFGSRLSD